MKVVVLGAGLMGKEVARDLVASDKVEKVFLADLDLTIAQDFANQLNSSKIEALELNAERDDELRAC
ncbi:saccharopine dehydrogenase, partial [Butyricicoccus sp. 1XD8-22]